MTRVRTWILALLLLGLFVSVAAVVLKARAGAGKEMPPFSVYAEGRDGLAPAARILGELGWQPVAVTRPIQNTNLRGLLIMAEPRESPGLDGLEDWPEAEVTGILQWVGRGNTLFLCGRRLTGIHRRLEVELTADAGAAPRPQVVTPGAGGGYTADVDRLEVEGLDRVQAPGALPLWWTERGPGALVIPHGKGRVLVVVDPSILTRRGLRRQDNVLFLYNVALLDAQDGKVLFDEYHHDLRAESGFWEYLRYHGQGWAVLPVLLFTAVAIWSVALRLGPPTAVAREPGGDAVAYAGGVVRILRLAGAAAIAGSRPGTGLPQALSRTLRPAPWRPPGGSAGDMEHAAPPGDRRTSTAFAPRSGRAAQGRHHRAPAAGMDPGVRSISIRGAECTLTESWSCRSWSSNCCTGPNASSSASARTIELMLLALLCGGHILLEGVPGTAKTLMARTLSRLLAPGLQARAVHPRPDALGYPRHQRLQPADQPVRVSRRSGVHRPPRRRRD